MMMGLKRAFDCDGVVMVEEPKWKFRKAVMDVMKGVSADELVTRMEPMFRRVVRQEVEQVIRTYFKDFNMVSRNPVTQAQTSHGRILSLRFSNKLPKTIFTGGRIVAEDGAAIELILFDPVSNRRVTSGPYSSLKVQILALDGDLGFEEQESWTEQDFNAKVIRARDGRRPLVTGELNILLRDGVGTVSDVSFSDNSSWIRCRRFRLAAKCLQTFNGQVRIQEAISASFVVKDHRGELYKKHHPPALNDEVWRLEKIAKDGKYHTRLADCNILSVMDFMRLYLSDPPSLKRILGCTNRIWESITQHASTCLVNDETYYAYPSEGVSLIFNSIYKLVAVTFDGRNYHPVDDLTAPHRSAIESIQKQAYQNLEQFVQLPRPSIGLQPELLPGPYNSPTSGLQHIEDPLAQQGSPESHSGYNDPSPSTSQQSPFSAAQPVEPFTPLSRNYSYKLADMFFPCNDDGVPGLAPEIMSQALPPTWSPVNTTLWTHNHNGYFDSGVYTPVQDLDVHFSRTGKTKAAWCKIRAVVKWRSVRHLAAKRMARPYYVSSMQCKHIHVIL